MGRLSYTLSLRFDHPVMRVEEITGQLGREPKCSWNVGDLHPHNKSVRNETYASFRFCERDPRPLNDLLVEMLNILWPHREFLISFVQSGGRLAAFTGVFAEGMVGENLEPGVMQALGDLNISLDLDMYFDPDPAESED